MWSRISIFGVALLALQACSGPVTVPPVQRAMPTWATMIHATQQGTMPLSVVGHPFSASDNLLPVALEAMSGQVFGRPFRFVQDEGAPPVRVVLAFNPPVTTDGDDLCQGKVQGGVPRGRVEALAAFCSGPDALSEVEGWVSEVAGPDDRRFRALLRQLTRDLFGYNDEERLQRQGSDGRKP